MNADEVMRMCVTLSLLDYQFPSRYMESSAALREKEKFLTRKCDFFGPPFSVVLFVGHINSHSSKWLFLFCLDTLNYHLWTIVILLEAIKYNTKGSIY
jgi:hypothetical protein